MQPPIGLDEKSVLERIVSRFLNLRQGTPSRTLRISLGQKRGLLDQLSNLGCLKTVGDQYVPTYMALEQVDQAIRQIVNYALDAVFMALKNLYVSQDKSSFTFEEILIAVCDVDPSLDENDVIPALAFATDFDFFSAWVVLQETP